MNAVDAFLVSLPGDGYHNVRRPVLSMKRGSARRASNSLRAWSRWSSEPSKRQRELDRHRLASLSGTETLMPVRTTHTSGKLSSAGPEIDWSPYRKCQIGRGRDR
jgi:hypothetical protein